MTLDELKTGESARIVKIGGAGALRQHFLDMGLIPGAEVKVVRFAPMGDPMEVRIHGYELSLRLDDAAQIEITRTDDIHEEEGEEMLNFMIVDDKVPAGAKIY
jgi:ferrous iron transport protein B